MSVSEPVVEAAVDAASVVVQSVSSGSVSHSVGDDVQTGVCVVSMMEVVFRMSNN